MPSPLRGRPGFRPGIVGMGLNAYDGSLEHYTCSQAGSPQSVRADGMGVAFLAIDKTTVWEEAFQGWALSGQTLDASSVALPGCKVEAFLTGPDAYIGDTVSDGAGNFSIPVGFNSGTFYLVAYKAGSPDVAGTTVNTLIAV